MSDGLIRTAMDWPAVFRRRITELGLSHLDVDHRAGLPDGYCNKILNGRKKPGAVTIEKLCRTLKLALRPEVDPN
jgi:predicted transcriptional regulator